MEQRQVNNPLHGITLQKIVELLVDYYGFDTLGELIKIKCFNENPSVKSSLTFLRKTDWGSKKSGRTLHQDFAKISIVNLHSNISLTPTI